MGRVPPAACGIHARGTARRRSAAARRRCVSSQHGRRAAAGVAPGPARCPPRAPDDNGRGQRLVARLPRGTSARGLMRTSRHGRPRDTAARGPRAPARAAVRRPAPPARAARLRALPSVDRLATAVAKAELAERRSELLSGATSDVDLVARARERLRPSLRRVLNATGVVVHPSLGRAPLAADARAAVAGAAEGYTNLELDLGTGERGSRQAHVEALLRELTGADAALAVNNCAAAVLLAAAALAGGGRDLVVSRGQLVEIGGAFRIPEVVAQAGARMVEVGTTNRTRLADYVAVLTDATGAILRAHPSNFRTLGFVEAVEIEALCGLGVPVVDDAGCGLP